MPVVLVVDVVDVVALVLVVVAAKGEVTGVAFIGRVAFEVEPAALLRALAATVVVSGLALVLEEVLEVEDELGGGGGGCGGTPAPPVVSVRVITTSFST